MGNSTAQHLKASFWRSFPLFEALDDAALRDLATIARPGAWAAGETIFQRGDSGDWLLAIDDGRVRLSLLTQAGRELTLRHAGPGDTLGEMAVFDREPRSADAVALVPTTGLVILAADLARLSDRHPGLLPSMARYFVRRLRETTEQLESIALYPLEARMARFLLFTLRQLNGDALPDVASLSLQISQSELAAVLGASRPKVNRVIQSLTAEGALTRDGDAWRCDTARLLALAEPDAD